MAALAMGIIALLAAAAFYARREDFVRSRMIDNRTMFNGIWIRGLRPLNRRDATIAAWSAVLLCLAASVVLLGVGALQVVGR